MSREDVCRCAGPKFDPDTPCPIHPKVTACRERTRAEAPQGETSEDLQRRACEIRCPAGYCEKVAEVLRQAKPAAQPDTGDADWERVREIEKNIVNNVYASWDGHATYGGMLIVAEKAFAAGQVAENEACERHTRDFGGAVAAHLADRIAARRGSKP
jgi:hypothetical protein